MIFQNFLLFFSLSLEFWSNFTDAVIENDNPANLVTPELTEDICKIWDIATFQEKLLSLHNKTMEEIRLLNKGSDLTNLKKFTNKINTTISKFQEIVQELTEGLTKLKTDLINEIQAQQNELRSDLEVFKSDLLKSLNIEDLPSDPNYDCLELYDGVNRIVTDNGRRFDGLCQDGWLYIMKRFDGSVLFYRDWAPYKDGFGDIEGEFFLGLDNLAAILEQFSYKLKIEFTLWDNDTKCEAEYQTFGVSTETSGYALTIGDYSGACSDPMQYSDGQKFSTRDKDNDGDVDHNIALENVGPGWYGILGEGSNIFGLFSNNPDSVLCQQWMCMFWFDEDEGKVKIMKSISMKITPL